MTPKDGVLPVEHAFDAKQAETSVRSGIGHHISSDSKTVQAVVVSLLSALITFLVFLAVLLPGEVARPLLIGDDKGNGIFVSDDYYVNYPDFKTVFMPKSIVEAIRVKQNLLHFQDGNRFVRTKGMFKSLPFKSAHLMTIPVQGANPTQVGLFDERAKVALRCIQTGAEIPVLLGPSETWFLAMVRVPVNWCSGEVEIVASSPSEELSVGFGTPLEVSRLFWIMNGRFGAVVGWVIAAVLFATLVLPFILLPRASILMRLGLVSIYPSLAGYLMFMFGWFAHSGTGLRIASVAFFIAPLIFALSRKLSLGTNWQTDIVRSFMAGSAALALVLLAPYLLLQIGGGIWFPGYAFFPASWSTDNLLSIMAAKSVLLLGPGHPEFLGHWSLGDRGVVQAGDLLAPMALPLLGSSLLQTQFGF